MAVNSTSPLSLDRSKIWKGAEFTLGIKGKLEIPGMSERKASFKFALAADKLVELGQYVAAGDKASVDGVFEPLTV
jgi:hypothetical protein